jgi:hypothetical protein
MQIQNFMGNVGGGWGGERLGGVGNRGNAGFEGGDTGSLRQQFGNNDGFAQSQGFGENAGLGAGLFNPQIGMGQMGNCNMPQMQQMMQQMMRMMQMMQSQGMGGPMNGGGQGQGGPDQCGGPGQGGPGNYGGQNGPCQPMQNNGGPNCAQGPDGVNGQQGQDGGTITLKKGDSYTTPGGCTVSWKDDKVSISDPNGGGGAQAQTSTQGPGPSRQFGIGQEGHGAEARERDVEQYRQRNGIGAEHGNLNLGVDDGNKLDPANAQHSTPESQQSSGSQQDFSIWGDPHITSPNGQQQNFATDAGLFTLSDGSKVLANAPEPNKPVESVEITLPGKQVNFNGVDPSKTTVYQDKNGQMTAAGTANQYMGGGFQGGLGSH